MNIIEANTRQTKTKGDLNTLRAKGEIPAVIYGGKDQNQNISFSKKVLKTLIDKENFLSNIINIKGINVYDILRKEKLVLTKSSIDMLNERLQ